MVSTPKPIPRTEDADSLNMGLVNRYAELCVRKKALKAELDRVTKEARSVGEALRDEMTRHKIKSIPVEVSVDRGVDVLFDGRVTVALRTKLFAAPRDGDKAALIQWLSSHAPDLVAPTYNSNSFTAYVRRGLDADNDAGLPPGWDTVIETSEVTEPYGLVKGDL